MMQRNAWIYGQLVFAALLTAPAFAQLIELEEPQTQEAGDAQDEEQVEMIDQNGNVIGTAPRQAPPAQLQARPQAYRVQAQPVRQLPAQPVTVSAGMAPQLVPQVQIAGAGQSAPVQVSRREVVTGYGRDYDRDYDRNYDRDYDRGNDRGYDRGHNDGGGLALDGVRAPTTGIGGSNPGNANTGGVQVQSVTVTATQDQDQRTDNNQSTLMKKVREMQEIETNQTAINALEGTRLHHERRLRGRLESSLDGLDSRDVIEVQPVNPPLSGPVIVAQNVPQYEVPYYAQNVTVRGRRYRDNGFKLVPFVGYRWFENNNAEYTANNLGIFGVALEGAMNRNLSIEGNFTYGRDDFNYRGFAGAGFGTGGFAPNDFYAARSRDSYEVGGVVKLGFTADKVKPYVLGGIGALYNRYNIDNGVTLQQLESVGLQRGTTHMTGVFGGGFDLAMSNNLAVGARFDYQSILNRKFTEMHRIYGDVKNRFRLQGNLQLIF